MTFSADKPTMIEFKDVHKYYGDYHALRGINGTIKAGEFFFALGSVRLWQDHASAHHCGV